MHIAEKTVLITGANRGIGAALVKEALNRERKEFLPALGVHFQILTLA
jgi:NAD(P)-dependent dehydrogenase (short-subunit alcohol dehydrogenase family)